MRWAHAMLRPRVGFLWGRELEMARQPFHGIHFAHSDLSGFALFEEAQDHGLRAAEEVLGALGRRGGAGAAEWHPTVGRFIKLFCGIGLSFRPVVVIREGPGLQTYWEPEVHQEVPHPHPVSSQ